jgi:hypothetical protein
MGNFSPEKLPPPGYMRIIAAGNYAPPQLPRAIAGLGSKLPLAQGIVAEILFYREAVKKIGADSPVFLSVFGQKNAPK